MSVLSDLLSKDSTAHARLDLAARKKCGRYMRQPADVDGSVQDAWLIAWVNGDKLKDPAKAEGWIARIAQNVCFKRMRKAALERKALRTLSTDDTTRAC